jgi:hypothetical protein
MEERNEVWGKDKELQTWKAKEGCLHTIIVPWNQRFVEWISMVIFTMFWLIGDVFVPRIVLHIF